MLLLAGAVIVYFLKVQEAPPPQPKVSNRDKPTADIPVEDFIYEFKGTVHLPAALKEQAAPKGRLFVDLIYIKGQKQVKFRRRQIKAPRYPVEFDFAVPAAFLSKMVSPGSSSYFQVVAWHCNLDRICLPSLYGQKIFASRGQPQKIEDFFGAGPSVAMGDVYINSLLIDQKVPGCPGPNRSMSGTISPYPPGAEAYSAAQRKVLIAYPLLRVGRGAMFGHLTSSKEIYVHPINSNGPTRFSFPNLPADRFYYATHVFSCGANDSNEICVKKFVSSMQEAGNPLKKSPFTASSDFQFMYCGGSDLKHYYYSGTLPMPGLNAPEFIRAQIGNLN